MVSFNRKHCSSEKQTFYIFEEFKGKKIKKERKLKYCQCVSVCGGLCVREGESVWENLQKPVGRLGEEEREVLRCAVSSFSFCFCTFSLCASGTMLEERRRRRRKKPDPVSSVVCPVWCHFLSCSSHAVLSVGAIAVLKEKERKLGEYRTITGVEQKLCNLFSLKVIKLQSGLASQTVNNAQV